MVDADLVTNCISQVVCLLVQLGEPSSSILGKNDLIVVPELVPNESQASSHGQQSLKISKLNPSLSEPSQVEKQLSN